MKKELLLLLAGAILFVAPVFWQTRNLTFRLDSDHDIGLPLFHYVVQSVREGRGFPLWNPYVGTGIPTIAEPLSVFLNPLLTLPLIILGEEAGLHVTIFLSILLSGIGMWIFLTAIGIKGFIRLWGSLLYQFSGALTAAMVAGHAVKFLSYPFIPLFWLFTIKPRMKWSDILGASFVLTMFGFSGDLYILWYASFFFAVIKVYLWLTGQEKFTRIITETVAVYALFFVLASVKLVPFYLDVLPRISRFVSIDPFVGSIHALWVPLPFIVPFRMAFYDRPFFRTIFGFHYNWYEYFAFVSPLPFVFLLKLRRVARPKLALLLLILLAVGVLYASIKYPYSPFYWLIRAVPRLGHFRVPQRIFTPMTSLLIALFALCAHVWWDKGKRRDRTTVAALCAASVLWTFAVGQGSLRLMFEAPRVREAAIAKELRQRDSGDYFVSVFVCCMQWHLFQQKIAILNFYDGWQLKDVPSYRKSDDTPDYTSLSSIRPKYLIAPKYLNFSRYSYEQFSKNGDIVVWRTETPNIFPSL